MYATVYPVNYLLIYTNSRPRRCRLFHQFIQSYSMSTLNTVHNNMLCIHKLIQISVSGRPTPANLLINIIFKYVIQVFVFGKKLCQIRCNHILLVRKIIGQLDSIQVYTLVTVNTQHKHYKYQPTTQNTKTTLHCWQLGSPQQIPHVKVYRSSCYPGQDGVAGNH